MEPRMVCPEWSSSEADTMTPEAILRHLQSSQMTEAQQLAVLLEAVKLFSLTRGLNLAGIGSALEEHGHKLNAILALSPTSKGSQQ